MCIYIYLYIYRHRASRIQKKRAFSLSRNLSMSYPIRIPMDACGTFWNSPKLHPVTPPLSVRGCSCPTKPPKFIL